MFLDASEQFVLCWKESSASGNNRTILALTLFRARAMSKVPTVSMLAAMIGIPVYVWPEFRKVYVRSSSTFWSVRLRACAVTKSFISILTSDLLLSVLRFGLRRTSLKSSLIPSSNLDMLMESMYHNLRQMYHNSRQVMKEKRMREPHQREKENQMLYKCTLSLRDESVQQE